VAPQQPHEIHGKNDLLEHFAHWEALGTPLTGRTRTRGLRAHKPAVKNIQRTRRAKR
jgi:hypothetical protein